MIEFHHGNNNGSRNLILKWLTFLVALSLGVSVSSLASAQGVGEDNQYSARLHAGTCESPELESEFLLSVATPQPATVEEKTTFSFMSTVDSTVTDLTSEPHSIVIVQNNGSLTTTIACGGITGSPTNGRVIIGLVAPNGNELLGMALISDEPDTRAAVEVFLVLVNNPTPAESTDGSDEDPPSPRDSLDNPEEPQDERDVPEDDV